MCLFEQADISVLTLHLQGHTVYKVRLIKINEMCYLAKKNIIHDVIMLSVVICLLNIYKRSLQCQCFTTAGKFFHHRKVFRTENSQAH